MILQAKEPVKAAAMKNEFRRLSDDAFLKLINCFLKTYSAAERRGIWAHKASVRSWAAWARRAVGAECKPSPSGGGRRNADLTTEGLGHPHAPSFACETLLDVFLSFVASWCVVSWFILYSVGLYLSTRTFSHQFPFVQGWLKKKKERWVKQSSPELQPLNTRTNFSLLQDV